MLYYLGNCISIKKIKINSCFHLYLKILIPRILTSKVTSRTCLYSIKYILILTQIKIKTVLESSSRSELLLFFSHLFCSFLFHFFYLSFNFYTGSFYLIIFTDKSYPTETEQFILYVLTSHLIDF